MVKAWDYIKKAAFALDPESAHDLALQFLRSKISQSLLPALTDGESHWQPGKIELMGLKFSGPVGIAAGFDKNALVFERLLELGFSHVEVGTVTFQPQKGNDRPRLFRLVRNEALINRMGFNNDGAAAIAERLCNYREKLQKGENRPKGIIGVNIGKNREISNEEAGSNYLAAFEMVYPAADYITINVSSPNTPGLRDLQSKKALSDLLKAIMEKRQELANQNPGNENPPEISVKDRQAGFSNSVPDNHCKSKPILVKISPDLNAEEIDQIAEACMEHGVNGIIATNTTSRRDLAAHKEKFLNESGGLSGRPLAKLANSVIQRLYKRLEGKLPIIGVGGVFTAEDAFEKIACGASLIQVYTGFIYQGPSIAAEINRKLSKILSQKGFTRLEEAIGCGLFEEV